MTDIADTPAEAPPVDPNAVAITVNGKPVVAQQGDLVNAAAGRAGEYIPRSCYHPRMSSVGICRQGRRPSARSVATASSESKSVANVGAPVA